VPPGREAADAAAKCGIDYTPWLMGTHLVVGVLGLLLVLVILRDTFEQLVLPQTVRRPFGPARLMVRYTWRTWRSIARKMAPGRPRERYLSVYGPFSLLVLLVFWGYALIFGFAMVEWAAGSRLDTAIGTASFGADLYMSGTTFFTLGLGDVTPNGSLAQILTVAEAGTGFGFLAIVIAYLPVLYGAFSRRELNISLLDARASSPPTAEELLRRIGRDHAALEKLLGDWERWAAELMESHLSYPVLGFYRSQHQNQSWLASLTCMLDVSGLAVACADGTLARQARLTFAIARHAVVDLAQIFGIKPKPRSEERITSEGVRRLRGLLHRDEFPPRADVEVETKLLELRTLYEPFVQGMGDYFMMTIPPWTSGTRSTDNWRTSAWGRVSAGTVPHTGMDVHDDAAV